MAAPLRPPAASLLSRTLLRPSRIRPIDMLTPQQCPYTRPITTTSTTTQPDESSMPMKLYYSLAYTKGPRTMNDFRDIAQRKRSAMTGVEDALSAEENATSSRSPAQTWEPRLPPKRTPPRRSLPLPAEQEIHPTLHSHLPLLRAQPPHYAVVYIHAKPYLVTQGDKVQLPFLMHGVNPGDVLRLDRVGVLGSRDYTLRGGGGVSRADQLSAEMGQEIDPAALLSQVDLGSNPASPLEMQASPADANLKPAKKGVPTFLPQALYTIRATVLGVESEPLRIKEKTKRRQRRVKTVKSKHRYTVLRISELKVHGAEELEAANAEASLGREVLESRHPIVEGDAAEASGETFDEKSIQ